MSGFRYDRAVPRFLDIDGVTLHVRDDGPPGAPALLLVHSLGTSVDVWDAQVRARERANLRVPHVDARSERVYEQERRRTRWAVVANMEGDAVDVEEARHGPIVTEARHSSPPGRSSPRGT